MCRLKSRLAARFAAYLLALFVPATAHADIFRWDNGQVIPGTEGITPETGRAARPSRVGVCSFGWSRPYRLPIRVLEPRFRVFATLNPHERQSGERQPNGLVLWSMRCSPTPTYPSRDDWRGQFSRCDEQWFHKGTTLLHCELPTEKSSKHRSWLERPDRLGFPRKDLRNAIFGGNKLFWSPSNLTDTNFSGANLEGASFASGEDQPGVTLTRVN